MIDVCCITIVIVVIIILVAYGLEDICRDRQKKEVRVVVQTPSEGKDRYCPSCGRSIPFDARTCPYCGKKFNEFF